MNKLIKDLAEQANVTKTYVDVNGVMMLSAVNLPNLEKFAELIIKECVGIIKHGMDHTEYDDPEMMMVELKTYKWCRDAIKEHFEIK